jgi:hypothetical protein
VRSRQHGRTGARPFFLPTRHLLPLLNCCAGGWRPMELESQPRRQESMRMRCGSADQRVDRPESTSWSAAAASAGLASFLPSASLSRCMSICLQPTAECRLHRSCKNETKKTTCSKSMVACHLSNSQKYQQRKVSLRSTPRHLQYLRRSCKKDQQRKVFLRSTPRSPCVRLLRAVPGPARPDGSPSCFRAVLGLASTH